MPAHRTTIYTHPKYDDKFTGYQFQIEEVIEEEPNILDDYHILILDNGRFKLICFKTSEVAEYSSYLNLRDNTEHLVCQECEADLTWVR
jgi:hypothetical protein